MKYTVVIHFKSTALQDSYDKTFSVDLYSHANCMLELFNYTGNITHMTLFPLADIASVDVTQVGE